MTGTDSYSTTAAENATCDGGAINWALITFKRLLNGPAKAINSLGYGVIGYSRFAAPLSQRQGKAIARYVTVIGSIILLLFHRGPPAVFGLITKRVVDAINGMVARRTRPHIFQKEPVVFPAGADRPRNIVSVSEILPNPVGASFSTPARIAMYRPFLIFLHNLRGIVSSFLKARGVHVFDQTAARARIAKNKAVSWRDECIAAITFALPQAVMAFINPKTANGCQTGKLLSTQILRFSHDWY